MYLCPGSRVWILAAAFFEYECSQKPAQCQERLVYLHIHVWYWLQNVWELAPFLVHQSAWVLQIILKPNTSPHLHLDFIEEFSCLKFKTVEIFIIITESIVIQSSTKAMYCWIRNTQQHAQPWIQVQTVYLVHQNYILVDKNHSTDTLRDHARKKMKLMSMIVLLLKSLILVKKLLTDEFRKTLKASTYWHIN